jgi:dTDP-4-dehydrorhamnose reductase
LREQYKVFLTYHSHPIRIPGTTGLPLHIEKADWAKRVAFIAKPDIIVFAAGSNYYGTSEKEARVAEQLHVGGPAAVSGVADILQPKFIYLSNCFVFDGAKGNYREPDTVLPGNAVGKAKLGGENFVRGKWLNYVVIRSSPIIGRGNGIHLSFLDRLRMALERKERVELSDHDTHSYAPMPGFVDMVARVAESGVRNKILHYGGLTKLTQYEWARRFAKRFGYDESLVSVKRQPPRQRGLHELGPRDFSLNSSLAMELLKIKPIQLEESFDQLERKLVPS